MRALIRPTNSVGASTLASAAPAGGARKRGWGCLISFIAALGTVGLTAAQEALAVPSGQAVTFHDIVQDRSGYGLSYHFRFLAPAIADGMEFELAAEDMETLCNEYALPRLADTGPKPSLIVIALLSEPVEFGDPNPDVTQFIEAYSVSDDACIWEPF